MIKSLHVPGAKIAHVGPAARYRVTTRAWTVVLDLVEAGRFHAYSDTAKQCPQCSANTTRKLATECPRCRVELEPAVYLVDVNENGGRGKCSCPSFAFNRRDETHPAEWVLCKHGAAAMMLHGHCMAVVTARRNEDRF